MIETRPLECPPYRGAVTAGSDGPGLREALSDLPGLLSSPSARILHSGRNTVVSLRITGLDGEVVVKMFGARGFHKLKTIILPSKAFRAWNGARALLEEGLETPPPVAWLERRKAGIVRESVYIAGHAAGGTEIRSHFRERDEADLRALLTGLAPVLARLHAGGLVHRDLSDGNVLIVDGPSSGAAGRRFLFLDTNRVRRRRLLGPVRRARSLVRLGVPAVLRPFFLEAYVRAAGGRFPRSVFFAAYRAQKRTFEGWLRVKAALRLRAAARRLKLQ